MAIIKVFDKYDLQREFERVNRDYYSMDGYQAMIDLFEETDTTFELDVIALCCDFNEEDAETIYNSYCEFEMFEECYDEESGEIDEDALMDALNYYTYAVKLDNGNIFYQCF